MGHKVTGVTGSNEVKENEALTDNGVKETEALTDNEVKETEALIIEVEGEEGRCSYCAQQLTGRDEVACARCHTSYHRVCWENFHKCAVYGCASRVYVVKEELPLCSDEAESKLELASEQEYKEPIEFDRSNFYIYLLFASLGMMACCCLTFFPIIFLIAKGLVDKYILYTLLGPKGPEILIIISSFFGGLLAALPARERLTINFTKGKLEATVTWMGRPLTTFELFNLEEINGLAIEEIDGRLWAYFSLAPSIAKKSAAISLRGIVECFVHECHIFAGRTLLSMGPKVDDEEAMGQWLVKLEDVSTRIDKSLLLPKDHPCIGLLTERAFVTEESRRELENQSEVKLLAAQEMR